MTDSTTALGQRMRAERVKHEAALDAAWQNLTDALTRLGEAKAAAAALEDDYAQGELAPVIDAAEKAVEGMENLGYWSVPS
jgi:hypothetical protein